MIPPLSVPSRKPAAERRYGVSISMSRVESDRLTELAARLGCSRADAVRRGLELLEQSTYPDSALEAPLEGAALSKEKAILDALAAVGLTLEDACEMASKAVTPEQRARRAARRAAREAAEVDA